MISSRVDSLGAFLALSAGIGSIVLVLWLGLAFAVPASRLLGRTAVSIGTPLLAILLAAVAIELILAGLDTHFLDLLSLMQRSLGSVLGWCRSPRRPLRLAEAAPRCLLR